MGRKRSATANHQVPSSKRKRSESPPPAIDESSLNDDYCVLCGHGGVLVCCQLCVQSFHLFCLGIPADVTVESLPDEWSCADGGRNCTKRVTPKREGDELTDEEINYFRWSSAVKRIGKTRYFTAFERADEKFSLDSFVLVKAAEDKDKFHIGQIMSLWEDEFGERWMELRWYWAPEETKFGRQKFHSEQELFGTAHVGESMIDAVECKVSVVSEEEYELREKSGALDEFVYFCKQRYNHDTGEYRPIIAEERSTNKKDSKIKFIQKSTVDNEPPVKLVSGSLYSRACAELQLSAIPKRLPCREDESRKVSQFLEMAIRSGGATAGGLYIHGVPGTGKTATIRQVIGELEARSESGDLPEFDFIEINGMKLPDPQHAYSVFYHGLTGKHFPPARAVELLDQRFKTASSRRPLTICLLDELDFILNKKQNVIYNFYDWQTRKSARLIVIGISNTMDLPELVTPRVKSRMGLTSLCFNPYKVDDLKRIISDRLAELSAVIFDPLAVEMCARKIASVSGDVRRALQICRRAAELTEAELEIKKLEFDEKELRNWIFNRNNDIKEDKNKNIMNSPGKKTKMKQIHSNNSQSKSSSNTSASSLSTSAAASASSSSSSSSSPAPLLLVKIDQILLAIDEFQNSSSAEFIKKCSLADHLLLAGYQSESKLNNEKEILSFKAVVDRARSIITQTVLNSDSIGFNDMLSVALRLGSTGIIRLEFKDNSALPDIRLGSDITMQNLEESLKSSKLWTNSR